VHYNIVILTLLTLVLSRFVSCLRRESCVCCLITGTDCDLAAFRLFSVKSTRRPHALRDMETHTYRFLTVATQRAPARCDVRLKYFRKLLK